MTTASASAPTLSRPRGFHWMRLLRAAQSSFDLRKAIIAALGLLVLHSGWELFELTVPGVKGLPPHLPGRVSASVATATQIEADAGWSQVRSIGWRLTEPVRILAGPLITLFEPGKGPVVALRAMLAVVWVIVVWGISGGAIARMTVREGAGRSEAGLLNSLRFGLRFAFPLIVAPLCPLLILGLCALACAAVGIIYWLPDPVGSILGGILLFIPLSLGFVMVLLFFGLVAGWPLFHASVAADAQGVLDSLSRCISYLHQRLAKYACYVLIAWIIGVPALITVNLLATAVIHLAAWGLSLAAPASSVAPLYESIHLGSGVAPATSALPALWRFAIGMLVRGWVYAYYWTAGTYIYMLLRHDVDGTSWTDTGDLAERENSLLA